MTSYCEVTKSVYPVKVTTIRHCSILEFGRGHTIKHTLRASQDPCTPLNATAHGYAPASRLCVCAHAHKFLKASKKENRSSDKVLRAVVQTTVLSINKRCASNLEKNFTSSFNNSFALDFANVFIVKLFQQSGYLTRLPPGSFTEPTGLVDEITTTMVSHQSYVTQ